jgi:DNA-binding winged helix-turn-helix (wHTH) protein/Flp pilus assembly protein TadD
MVSRPALRFGDFELDARRHLLMCGGREVDLSAHLVDILEYLAARHGELVTKDELLERFWPDVNVTDNTLARAIADIRRALGETATTPRYIQTASRRGYRFVATAVMEPAGDSPDPFHHVGRGRAALESLDERRLPDAVSAFEQAIAAAPDYAVAHVGLANARFLQYEMTRATNAPRREWLIAAEAHARSACALDGRLGDAVSTLGFVLTAAGQVDEARAMARKAVALEPNNWRHYSRLSVATWGEERLRACARTLEFMPDFAPARYAAAMVFVARQAFAPARAEAEAGAAAQSRQVAADGAAFPAIGLHWLSGMLALRAGDAPAALGWFARELLELREHQVYALEFRVNAEVASGFAHLVAGDPPPALECFHRALAVHPRNGRALVGCYTAFQQLHAAADVQRTATDIDRTIEELILAERLGEAALIRAAAHAARGEGDQACAILLALLEKAPPGHVGWLIPIDPALTALNAHPRFQEVLALLSSRAA